MGALIIASGASRAVIDPHGAYVAELSLKGGEVTMPSGDGAQTHGGIAVLAPYAGRVRDGRYRFGGEEFRLPTGKGGHAIHGFAKDALWESVEARGSAVVLRTPLEGEGYPGKLVAVLSYSVGENVFSTDCQVRNAGKRDSPVVVGFHPYFVARGWKIELESQVKRYELRDGFFPTGKTTAFSFEGAGPDTALDDCFIAEGKIRIHREAGELTIVRRGMPYFVVYDGKYAEGRSVAVEPYTGLPDAYNNGIGLKVLAPGQALRCGYDIAVG